jgi:acetyl esterase/lipase
MKFALFSLAASLAAAAPSPTENAVIDYFESGRPTLLRLWPADSPRNKSRNGEAESTEDRNSGISLTNTEHPSLLVYSPPEGAPNTGAALIFCPGGGYSRLSMGNPKSFTQWMNHLGVTVATLKYHVPRSPDDPKRSWPLADAQRAVRVLRSQAKQLQLSPDKIGIVGSSAGGHLAFNLCLNHAQPAYEPIDELDQLSCRPALGLLFYPAYLTQSKKTLDISPNLQIDRLSAADTPPIFVTVNGDDSFASGSLRALIELQAKKVPGELHLWTRGGHGGVFDKYPLAEFARPGIRFLMRHGLVPEALIARSDAWLQAEPSHQKQTGPAPNPPPGLTELSPIDQDVRRRYGQDRPVYRLWPGDGTRAEDPLQDKTETLKERNVPVASDVTSPTLTFFPADKPDGRAVLVFPGGGYSVLAHEHEGLDLARWLNTQGISAFLLKYRTPRRANLEKHHVALQDAQRAIRLVRSQAAQFGLREDAIGVLGFSAGGHLASLASTPLENSYAPIDDHDSVSPLADFAILIYPAYTSTDGIVDPLLKTPAKAPLFVATALDDKWTEGQFYFLHERLQAGQPIEYHIYENGGHGKGMQPAGLAFAQWPRECARWLRDLERE